MNRPYYLVSENRWQSLEIQKSDGDNKYDSSYCEPWRDEDEDNVQGVSVVLAVEGVPLTTGAVSVDSARRKNWFIHDYRERAAVYEHIR